MDIDVEKIGDTTIATTKTVVPTTTSVGAEAIHPVSEAVITPSSLPADGAKTEEPWILAPESETGGTRPSSLLGVNPGDDKFLSAFAISHHRDNLVEIVEETESLLSRLGLGSWSNRRKGASSAAESDGWARPTPQDPRGLQKSYRISFAELQRMHLRKLQCKLVKHVVDIRFRNKEPDGWEADLQSYTKALQDYDYMFTHSQRLRDDFLVTGERFIDDYVLHTMLDAEAGKDAKLASSPPITVAGPWEDKHFPIGGTRSENRAKSELAQLRDRTVMALLGGLFLVGPMWLMMLHKTLYTCLVATTVCVTIFGLVMARLLDKPMEVLSGTAAYAAVLVVFVGLNNADGAERNTSA
ncbi:hypothetical protein C8A01DRAFT_43113 [Parachaetomium inaequale]|uniref:DUF6594 domain-containing protein n=1 Tax=Parachaetomium inaequale TaxID=2588326 RepID=A0AAN6PQ79_9PEZI|nr:hypothetical protein C8A01DRAFT_43113 [Parachaetomium inaequale]